MHIAKAMTGDTPTTCEGSQRKGMTDEEYGAAGGGVCPFCRGEQILADSAPETDGVECRQTVRCLDCGEEWTDVYRLQGYLSATGATYDDAEACGDTRAPVFAA
jgi:hypothetical protein